MHADVRACEELQGLLLTLRKWNAAYSDQSDQSDCSCSPYSWNAAVSTGRTANTSGQRTQRFPKLKRSELPNCGSNYSFQWRDMGGDTLRRHTVWAFISSFHSCECSACSALIKGAKVQFLAPENWTSIGHRKASRRSQFLSLCWKIKKFPESIVIHVHFKLPGCFVLLCIVNIRKSHWFFSFSGISASFSHSFHSLRSAFAAQASICATLRLPHVPSTHRLQRQKKTSIKIKNHLKSKNNSKKQ